jgi:hypothetical protein
MASEVSWGDCPWGSEDIGSVWPRGGEKYGKQLGHALVLYDQVASQGGGDSANKQSVI